MKRAKPLIRVVDTNEVWVKFEKGIEPVSTYKFKKLSIIEKERIKIRKPFLTSWWFEDIIEQQPANDSALNAEI